MLRAAPLLAVAAAAFAACGGPTIALQDLDGKRHSPTELARGQVHVLVFTSHECPIANAYAPTLRTLAAAWQAQPVRLFLVHVDPDLAVATATRHARNYELPGTILLDPRHQLAAALGVTRTPEAVVLNGAGLVYRGRIDDQWRELGARQSEASVHDLRVAVATALEGRVVSPPYPQAVGCLLPDPAR